MSTCTFRLDLAVSSALIGAVNLLFVNEAVLVSQQPIYHR